jgi:hypothetical protein
VQGGLLAWMLSPVLTFVRVAVIFAIALLWLVLDSYNLAPFTLEVLLAQMLGLASPKAKKQ